MLNSPNKTKWSGEDKERSDAEFWLDGNKSLIKELPPPNSNMDESVYVLATCLCDEMPPGNLVVNLTYWNGKDGEYISFGGLVESLSTDELAKQIVKEFRQTGDGNLLSRISFCSPYAMPNGEPRFSKEGTGRPLTFEEFESLQERLTTYSRSSSSRIEYNI